MHKEPGEALVGVALLIKAHGATTNAVQSEQTCRSGGTESMCHPYWGGGAGVGNGRASVLVS